MAIKENITIKYEAGSMFFWECHTLNLVIIVSRKEEMDMNKFKWISSGLDCDEDYEIWNCVLFPTRHPSHKRTPFSSDLLYQGISTTFFGKDIKKMLPIGNVIHELPADN